MKLVILAVALVTSLPVFPQDAATTLPNSFTIYRTRDGFRVSADGGRTVSVIAASMENPKSPASVVRFKGNVQVTIDGVELQADELDYHWDTGELEPYGNVHVKPL